LSDFGQRSPQADENLRRDEHFFFAVNGLPPKSLDRNLLKLPDQDWLGGTANW